MPPKRAKAAANDDIDELFEGIGGDGPKKQPAKSKGSSAKGKGEPEKDILAELENQLGEKQPERPHTPRIKDGGPGAAKKGTPPSDNASEDKTAAAAGKSAESTASLRASFTPSATGSELQDSEKKGTVEQAQAAASDGGWWGGWSSNILTTATAAMKQAEAAVSHIQQNEDARKWAEQVRGNVGALRGIGKSHFLPPWAL